MKTPKQSHLDYLLTTIESEPDPVVSRLGPLFKETHNLFVSGTITEEQVRSGLTFLKFVTAQKAEAKYRTDQLLGAAIDYIINPEFKVQDHLRDPS